MEDEPEFHGRGLTHDEYARAMAEIGADGGASTGPRERRTTSVTSSARTPDAGRPGASTRARPHVYASRRKTDNRSAWGKALVDLAEANPGLAVAVLDCDLAVSVKTDGFAARASRPASSSSAWASTMRRPPAGALSTVPGVLAFWSDFGVFGIDEVYNQQRLNDINGAALKVAVTHCGLDVGEDGKTHQCLDYVGALRNFFGWKVIVPADPNQTDRAVRAAAVMQGNVAIAMGRSKLEVVVDEQGEPLFGGQREFRYGEIVWAREGNQGCVLALGALAGAAVAAADALEDEGISIAVGVVSCPLHLDEAAMRRASAAPFLLTVEDHNVRTGLGGSVAEFCGLDVGEDGKTHQCLTT